MVTLICSIIVLVPACLSASPPSLQPAPSAAATHPSKLILYAGYY